MVRRGWLAALAGVGVLAIGGAVVLGVTATADDERQAEARDREPEPQVVETPDMLEEGEALACTAEPSGDVTKERALVWAKQAAAWVARAAPGWSGAQLVDRAARREQDMLTLMISTGPGTAACRAASDRVVADDLKRNPLPAYVPTDPAPAYVLPGDSEEDRVRDAAREGAREGAQEALDADRASHPDPTP